MTLGGIVYNKGMANSKITIIRGDDVTRQMTFTNADGTPFDLTNYTILFTVKKRVRDTDADALIAIEWNTHTNPTQGETTFSLTHNQTDITAGLYTYDFQLRLNSVVTSTRSGCFEVLQDITQRIS